MIYLKILLTIGIIGFISSGLYHETKNKSHKFIWGMICNLCGVSLFVTIISAIWKIL